jgi:branched-chain amino acid transport system ATP-binding protein
VTQGLAPGLASDMARTLRRLADDGLGVLLVEQNSQLALEIADRVCVLDQGTVVAAGEATHVGGDVEQYLKL